MIGFELSNAAERIQLYDFRIKPFYPPTLTFKNERRVCLYRDMMRDIPPFSYVWFPKPVIRFQNSFRPSSVLLVSFYLTFTAMLRQAHLTIL